MSSQSKNSSSAPKSITQTPLIHVHHRIRTFFASVFGMIALLLIFVSTVVVWLNRTITNTGSYVTTVAPLVAQPDIQDFIAQKASQQIIDNAPTQDLANTLLTPADMAGQKTDQLKLLLQPVVQASVGQVIRSPQFAALWDNTNRSAHQQLIEQLKNGSSQISLDLSPVVSGVISQLKNTQLAPITNKISIKPDAGKLNLKGSGIDKAHTYYTWFQKGTLAIVVAALAASALCVLISVHHIKTMRRIVLGTGIIALVIALALQVPSFIALSGSNLIQQKATVALVHILFRRLQIASLVLGVGCVVLVIGSKIYSKLRTKTV